MKTIVNIVLIVFSATLLQAQDFIIQNVTLFNGEDVKENVSVLVKDGVIEAVGKSIKSDVTVIDGKGKFLLPAMTNSHVHSFNKVNLEEAAQAGVLNLLDMHGVEMMQPFLKGFNDSIGYARYYYAGYAATAPGGHGTQYGFPVPTLSTVEDAKGFVEGRIKAGAHYIKIIEEPWKPTLSHDIVKAVIDAAHDNGTIAVVHISKVADAHQVLMNNANGLVHIWWDKKISEEQLKELSQTKEFFVIPTVLTSHLALKTIRASAPEGSFLTDEEISSEVKRLYDAGVPILAGTDPPNANINYGTDLYKELVLLSKAGIPGVDVLKTATSHPADFFKLEKVGYIKPGFKADMILLEENPILNMENINSVETIWKEGTKVE